MAARPGSSLPARSLSTRGVFERDRLRGGGLRCQHIQCGVSNVRGRYQYPWVLDARRVCRNDSRLRQRHPVDVADCIQVVVQLDGQADIEDPALAKLRLGKRPAVRQEAPFQVCALVSRIAEEGPSGRPFHKVVAGRQQARLVIQS